MIYSKKIRITAVLLFLVGGTAGPAFGEQAGESPAPSEACYHRVCFPAHAEVGGWSLPLRSAGKKDWWKFSLYDAGLYTAAGVSKEQVLSDIPKKLVLRYRRSIPAKKIAEASDHKLAQNPDINLPAIRERVDYLHSLYQSVKKGDVYALAYDPARGTQLYFNGIKQGELIPGNDFAKAYFGIWLSRHVVCRKLRWELLDLK
jgi:hypothetical protein